MNILVIKQTSLGDVLHSTGHVHAIKRAYPNSHLTVLTSTTCAPIYAHHPDVDRLLTVDRARVKKVGLKHPVWAWRHMADVVKKVNERQYDLAIDLQGLAKSVLFLYLSTAKHKVVKGNWWGLAGFRDKQLHALTEMDEVLRVAGVEPNDTSMAFHTAAEDQTRAEVLLKQINPGPRQSTKPLIIVSPFTRWASKNWPLAYSIEAAGRLSEIAVVAISGAPGDQAQIAAEIARQGQSQLYNLAGKANLATFAEVMRQANLLITGDSFPMHLAGAVKTPVLALFGPTDEQKTGPLEPRSQVIRAPDCEMCDRAGCEKQCLARIPVATVVDAARKMLP